jgi:diaminohydroxyphosphoribosylaminopyrimidine deaminase / 5-amino-6-(5-phosphoribosylamino)uracil reductase
MFTEQDHFFMSRALELARKGLFSTTPNPRVGCVLVKDGEMVGEGWHRRAGEPHAEALALAQAGDRARGATAYVTLEPCSHFGRTPPCARALIEARVAKVVAAMEDPNPQVSGHGFDILRAAGIEVRCGLLQEHAQDLNRGFVSRMTRGRPWVRMKIAASLDGVTALDNGRSQWITGEAARHDGHLWRARACAILTGMGTVLQDDPLLNVRGVETDRQPLRVVVDSRLQINRAAKVLQTGSDVGPSLVLASIAGSTPSPEQLQQAEGLPVAWIRADDHGKNDLAAALQELGRRGINELHVEAGHKLNGSLLKAGLVDELLVYMAPQLLGSGQGMAALGPFNELDQALRFELQDTQRLGADLRLIFVRPIPTNKRG